MLSVPSMFMALVSSFPFMTFMGHALFMPLHMRSLIMALGPVTMGFPVMGVNVISHHTNYHYTYNYR